MTFDINDKTTWRATCDECGSKKMTYNERNYTYHCPKCGFVLEV